MYHRHNARVVWGCQVQAGACAHRLKKRVLARATAPAPRSSSSSKEQRGAGTRCFFGVARQALQKVSGGGSRAQESLKKRTQACDVASRERFRGGGDHTIRVICKLAVLVVIYGVVRGRGCGSVQIGQHKGGLLGRRASHFLQTTNRTDEPRPGNVGGSPRVAWRAAARQTTTRVELS